MKKRRRYKKKVTIDRKNLYIKGGIVLLLLLAAVLLIRACVVKNEDGGKPSVAVDASKPDMDVQLLTVNEDSRPGTESKPITGIVVHYTANPGSTAQNNRDYFEGLKDSHETQVSSHFVVGMEGEIVQCVPTWEIAYASNSRNADTVSIECCHPDTTGEFTDETYKSLVQLTAWLCTKFGLSEEAVLRHYDVTEKNCPKYFVENEDAWKQFKIDVKAAIEKSGA